MILSVIAAVARNNVIGNENKLLWHMPADLKHFKSVTSGHSVIMGRKTYESIGRALPNRRNIVISRQAGYSAAGCEMSRSLDEAITACKGEEEVFIIGGADIYRQALSLSDRIYLTRVAADFKGDAYFPEINFSEWKMVETQHHKADEKNGFDYSFSTYHRI